MVRGREGGWAYADHGYGMIQEFVTQSLVRQRCDVRHAWARGERASPESNNLATLNTSAQRTRAVPPIASPRAEQYGLNGTLEVIHHPTVPTHDRRAETEPHPVDGTVSLPTCGGIVHAGRSRTRWRAMDELAGSTPPPRLHPAIRRTPAAAGGTGRVDALR